MSYYRTCPHCGANLDPGERCNCFESRYAALTPENRAIVDEKIHELYTQQLAGKKAEAVYE